MKYNKPIRTAVDRAGKGWYTRLEKEINQLTTHTRGPYPCWSFQAALDSVSSVRQTPRLPNLEDYDNRMQ
ncbi:MAG TPA: hypothetical protein HA230_03665 [Candidatus Aenigmarchaeota archaeon]|nr:hypothetical protein [Candidatus Aenigmarchaeota archaeon]